TLPMSYSSLVRLKMEAPCCQSHSMLRLTDLHLMSFENDILKSGFASPTFPRTQQVPSARRPTLPKTWVADWPGRMKKHPSEHPNPPTRKPALSGTSRTVLRFSQNVDRNSHCRSGRLMGDIPRATSMPRLRSLPAFW